MRTQQRKRILVTGGSGFIGSEICRTAHAYGARVLFTYHSGEAAARALQAELPDSLAIPLDLRDVGAIARGIEALPADARGVALIETADASEQLPIAAPAGVDVRWIVRGDEKPGILALNALTALDLPTEPFYAFIVGEQSLPASARRHLVAQGVSKDAISFVGYWRTGAASPTPKSQLPQASTTPEGTHA